MFSIIKINVVQVTYYPLYCRNLDSAWDTFSLYVTDVWQTNSQKTNVKHLKNMFSNDILMTRSDSPMQIILIADSPGNRFDCPGQHFEMLNRMTIQFCQHLVFAQSFLNQIMHTVWISLCISRSKQFEV